MIKIPGPAMVCNAAEMGNFIEYKMWNTRTVDENVPPAALAANIVSVAKSAPREVNDGRACYIREFALEALVLNCHGLPGELGMCGRINSTNVAAFSVLKGLISQIYIVACGVAGVRMSIFHTGYLDGPSFCVSLAKTTGAYLIAPTTGQRQSKEDRSEGIPMGFIDDYEGEVKLFSPDGQMSTWTPNTAIRNR